jgi:hypothetical protein
MGDNTEKLALCMPSTHSWKRRWQVWYGGYFSSKSFKGVHVRQIQSMPFNMEHLSPLGLPEIFLDIIY